MQLPPKTLGLALTLLFAIVALLLLKPFILSLATGALLAYLTFPFYQRVGKKYPSVAALLLCLLTILVIAIPIGYLAQALVHESYVLFIAVKQKLAIGFFRECSSQLCETVKGFVTDPEVQFRVQEFTRTITNSIIADGRSFLLRLPRIALHLFVAFFSMFYFLKDGKYFLEHLRQYLHLAQDSYSHLLKRMEEITRGILYGYVLVALLQGALGAVGFWAVGIPSPIFWGGVMAFLSLIPSLGAAFIWVPAAMLLFFSGLFEGSTAALLKGAGLFAYGAIVISLVDNILRPKFVERKAKIHPLLVTVGILGGVLVLGLAGAIFGPLILALSLLLIEVYIMKDKEALPEKG